LVYAKPFCAKFSPVKGSSYPIIYTKFGEFMLKLDAVGVHLVHQLTLHASHVSECFHTRTHVARQIARRVERFAS